jgi:hypothetical protein
MTSFFRFAGVLSHFQAGILSPILQITTNSATTNGMRNTLLDQRGIMQGINKFSHSEGGNTHKGYETGEK